MNGDKKQSAEEQLIELTQAYSIITRSLWNNNSPPDILKETPLRAAKAMQYLAQGETALQEIHHQVSQAVFAQKEVQQGDGQIVIVKNITLHSVCEHHLLPFSGVAHIAYIPKASILGLSKFARIVDAFARRINLQERLTKDIANYIDDILKPNGTCLYEESRGRVRKQQYVNYGDYWRIQNQLAQKDGSTFYDLKVIRKNLVKYIISSSQSYIWLNGTKTSGGFDRNGIYCVYIMYLHILILQYNLIQSLLMDQRIEVNENSQFNNLSSNEQQQLVKNNQSIFSIDEDSSLPQEPYEIQIELQERQSKNLKKKSNLTYSIHSDESEDEEEEDINTSKKVKKTVKFIDYDDIKKIKRHGSNDTPFQNLILTCYFLIIAKNKFMNLLFRKFYDKYTPFQLKVILNKVNDKTFDNEQSQSDLKKMIAHDKMKSHRSLKKKMLAKNKNLKLMNLVNCCETIYYNIIKQTTNLYYYLQKSKFFLVYFDFTQNQNFRVVWDIIYLFIIVFQSLYIPLYITFNLEFENKQQQWIYNDGPLLFLSLDIVLNFVTGYFSKGVWISDYKTIARHYFKNFFVVDLISIVPQFLVKADLPREIQFLFMLKFIRLRQVLKKLEDRFMHLIIKIQTFYNLFNLFIGIMYMSHLTACVMFYISKRQFDQGKPTMFSDQIEMAKTLGNFPYMYVTCLYFSVVTIVTVGYGDFSPKDSEVEKIYVMVMILIGCGQHAYSISTIGNIIADLNKDQDKIRYKIGDLNTYMLKNNVPKQLMFLARKNLEYVLSEQMSANSKINELIPMLDQNIAKKMKAFIYGRQVNRMEIFKLTGLFRKELLDQLADIALESTFAAETEIVRKDDIYLYFIESGKAQVQAVIDSKLPQDNIIGSKFQELEDIKQGNTYNVIPFFNNQRNKNIRLMAKRLCRVLLVPRSKFIVILQGNNLQEENIRFNQIKDNIVINKCYLDILQSCYLCKSYNHYYTDCPLLFYQPDIQALQKLENQPIIHRKPYSRKKIRMFHFQKDSENSQQDLMAAMQINQERGQENKEGRRYTTRYMQTLIMTSINQWRDKNISFCSEEVQQEMKKGGTNASLLSDEYSVFSESQDQEQVIIEEQEEEEMGEVNDIVDHKIIESSQKNKSKRQTGYKRSSTLPTDYLINNGLQVNKQKQDKSQNKKSIKNRNSMIGRDDSDKFQRISGSQQANRESINQQGKSSDRGSRVSSQFQSSKRTSQAQQLYNSTSNPAKMSTWGSTLTDLLQRKNSPIQELLSQLIPKTEEENNHMMAKELQERHEKMILMNQDYSYRQTIALDSWCNWGKGYFEHNDVAEIIKKINLKSQLKIAVIECEVKIKKMIKNVEGTEKEKERLQKEGDQKNSEYLKKMNKLFNSEQKQEKALKKLKVHRRISLKQDLQYNEQQESFSMRVKKIMYKYNPLLRIQKITLNYRSYVKNIQKFIGIKNMKKSSMMPLDQKTKLRISKSGMKARSSKLNIRESIMDFQIANQTKKS